MGEEVKLRVEMISGGWSEAWAENGGLWWAPSLSCSKHADFCLFNGHCLPLGIAVRVSELACSSPVTNTDAVPLRLRQWTIYSNWITGDATSMLNGND